MNRNEVQQYMVLCGTEQNKKTYHNHGVKGDCYGVSFAELGKLQKRIKKNTSLALELWNSANHDERMLATMIIESKSLTEALLQEWVTAVDNYVLADAVAKVVASSPIRQWCIEHWLKSDEEWKGQIAWDVLAQMAMNGNLPEDGIIHSYILYIEQTIHRQKNRVRHAMNNALIAIAMKSEYRARVFQAADTIGVVKVNHGKTNCKTPNIRGYIDKIEQQQVQKQLKAKKSQQL